MPTDPSHLISKRAASRSSYHFTNAPAGEVPIGFKPHLNPLLLSYGMPNHGFFPIDSIDVNIVDYPFQTTLDHAKPNGSSTSDKINDLKSSDSENNQHDSLHTIHIERIPKDPKLMGLKSGLQYAAVEGHQQLLQFTKDFIQRTHNPNYDNWTSFITNGASDGLNKACDALLDPDDVILVEEFTFSPFLRFLENSGAIAIPVRLNLNKESDGLDLDHLVGLLENWKEEHPELPKPKALYTIATGHNPTGFTQSLEFRKKVYALAEKYDFAIIEDDPYGYLTLPTYTKPDLTKNPTRNKSDITVDDYLKNHLTPSYLELDTTGRVIRVETFSKLFAPGLRLGFVIAHVKIIEAIKNYSEVINRGALGLTQTIVNNVIQDNFKGVEGWLEWILKMRSNYAYRKDLLLYSIFESEAYKKGYVDVIDPKAGMFVTFLINLPPDVDVLAKMKLLLWKLISYGVLVVPGYNMTVDQEYSKARSNFFRLCVAIANNEDEILESGKRLTDGVLEFFNNGLEY